MGYKIVAIAYGTGEANRALFGFCLYTACRVNEACTQLSEDVYNPHKIYVTHYSLLITLQEEGRRQNPPLTPPRRGNRRS